MRVDIGALLLAAVVVAEVMPNAAFSQSVSGGVPPSTYCEGLINSGAAASQYQLSGILPIAVLIMLVMLMVSGVAYALGRAFMIGRLTNFAKTEIGEVIITGLIVVVFLGTFALSTRVAGAQNFLAIDRGYANTPVFVKDCSYLSDTSVTLMDNYFIFAAAQTLLNLITNLKLSVKLNAAIGSAVSGSGPLGGIAAYGFNVTPFKGLTLVTGESSFGLGGLSGGNGIMGNLLTISSSIAMLLIGMTVFLSFIYALFPIFFYIGIVLRTFTLTRAAGGAFLGLFIGFYIFLPLMLSLTLGVNSAYLDTYTSSQFCSSTGLGCPSSSITTWLGNAWNLISSPFQILGCGLSSTSSCLYSVMIQKTIEPAMYTLAGVVLSLIFSFDFGNAVGDMLGAPSLSTRSVLKRWHI